MAEGGDGNIKVVVRCRPLNSRGASFSFLSWIALTDNILPSIFACSSTLAFFQYDRVGTRCKATHSDAREPDLLGPT